MRSRSGVGLVLAVGLALGGAAHAVGQEREGDPRPFFLGDSALDLVYTPVTPCRIINTRALGAGGALAPGAPRDFHVTGTAEFDTQGGNAGGCGIPSGATAAMVNFVAVNAAGAGNLRAWPFGQAVPTASVINYSASVNIANGVVVALCDPATATCGFDLTVRADASATQLVADVMGFFQAPSGTLGTINGVTAGAGLTGGGTSGNVTVGVAPGGITAALVQDGSLGASDVDSSQVQLRVGSCAVGSSIRSVNADGTVVCQTDTTGSGWELAGNAGTNPATNFIGTTDNQAFELRVNNLRAARIEPRATIGTFQGPNVVLGHEGNSLTTGVQGAVVAGGGGVSFGNPPASNQVTGHFGTVGGGVSNRAGDLDADPGTGGFATVGGGVRNTASGGEATVGGGASNTASASEATVGGGVSNTASGGFAAVGGGEFNTASGVNATVGGGVSNTASGGEAMVGGGEFNTASGLDATVGGGRHNTASGVDAMVGGGQSNTASALDATVGGGQSNTANGNRATVPGGFRNAAGGDFSFAAGRQAKVRERGLRGLFPGPRRHRQLLGLRRRHATDDQSI
jgi:hypothetical protein